LYWFCSKSCYHKFWSREVAEEEKLIVSGTHKRCGYCGRVVKLKGDNTWIEGPLTDLVVEQGFCCAGCFLENLRWDYAGKIIDKMGAWLDKIKKPGNLTRKKREW
jgi:hypothetical protein